MSGKCALTAIVSALALALPSAAAAVTLVPPGKAGANQYFETVPTSNGNAAPPQGSTGSPAGGGLPRLGQGRTGASRLARLGSDGAAAAAFDEATAPPAASGTGTGTGAAGADLAPPSGGSPLSSLAKALTGSDSGGLGLLLPLLLGATLIAAVAAGVARARRAGTPPELGP